MAKMSWGIHKEIIPGNNETLIVYGNSIDTI